MTDEVRIEGLKEVVAALKALPAELGSGGGGPLRAALFKAAKIIRDDAEARAPVLTGNLRANIYVYRDRNPRASTGAAERYLIGVRTKKRRYADTRLNRRMRRVGKNFTIRGDAFYWWFVEFGTSKIGARPFLRPAFEQNKHKAVAEFTTALSRAVDAAVARARQRTQT